MQCICLHIFTAHARPEQITTTMKNTGRTTSPQRTCDMGDVLATKHFERPHRRLLEPIVGKPVQVAGLVCGRTCGWVGGWVGRVVGCMCTLMSAPWSANPYRLPGLSASGRVRRRARAAVWIRACRVGLGCAECMWMGGCRCKYGCGCVGHVCTWVVWKGKGVGVAWGRVGPLYFRPRPALLKKGEGMRIHPYMVSVPSSLPSSALTCHLHLPKGAEQLIDVPLRGPPCQVT